MANGAKYITILRDPWSQFKSSFSFFNWAHVVEEAIGNTTHHLEKFLNNPGRFYKWQNAPIHKQYMRNFMSFDLGLPLHQYDDVNAIVRFVNMIEKDFDLVMLLEYFDESLILLKRLLCWKLEDILYLKINQRKKLTPVQSNAEQLYRHFSQADYTLYEHFAAIIQRRMSESPGLHEEVAYFREINLEYLLFCKQASRNESLLFEVDRSNWNLKFTLDVSYCTKSRLYILHYVDQLKRTRYGIGTETPTRKPFYWHI
ncbi:galactosylceramide sulfotransferase-like [Saccoglossus kowalevskii]|uniref:Galactosylceramide sulfotransferase-like n=1 Tax=Saccoglossus kowalevskii TaxID=10224 RepID=A0ABM0M9L9_SACKO|nr:PREDICTED: galactosylceramide sulfotransferase-like [Saccoglossus kowalevskii]